MQAQPIAVENHIEPPNFRDGGRVQGDDAVQYKFDDPHSAWQQCIQVVVKKEKQGDETK